MALELAEARQAGHTARCEGDQSLLAPGWSPCPGRQGGCCSDPGGRAWGLDKMVMVEVVWARVLKVEQRGCGDDLSEGVRTPRFLCSEELSER